MKCEKCGKEISNLLVNVFTFDGSDSECKYSITECEEYAVFFHTNANWTGYELSEEEQKNTISCPYCKQFPFEQEEIQVEDLVRVVCFKKHMNENIESKPLLSLEPCPFCGTNLDDFPQVMTVKPVRTEEYLIAKLEHKKIIGSDAGYNVFCVKCGALGARGMTKEEAIKKWNERK